MSYIPAHDHPQVAPTVNPPTGEEKNGDFKIDQVNGTWTAYIRINNDWKQIFPAVFA
jgi:hypothetical protein